MRTDCKLLGVLLLTSLAMAGCSGDKSTGGTPDGSVSPTRDATTDGDGSDSDGQVRADGGMPSGQDSGTPADAGTETCGETQCHPGQHCEMNGDTTECVNTSCAELTCEEGKSCEAHPQGGHVCVPTSCSADVNCASEWFCSAGTCTADVCSPGTRHCDGNQVYECAANGSEEAVEFACQNTSYFDSQCSETASVVTCSCLDDWNCPAFTECEAGSCEGTGRAPTCSLPAVAFSDTQPGVELFWGGPSPDDMSARDGTEAHNPAPWADYSHVVNTPIVANLDDDNGDGLINELDFAEIVFASYQGNNHWGNGVLRAIHGGGPKKGADYFAICGDTLWTEGMPLPGACSSPSADSGAAAAVGDLNNDGLPEIVYTLENALFRILDHTGKQLYQLTTPYVLDAENGDAPSIANLDHAGYAEIILGNIVYVLGEAAGGGITLTHILNGTAGRGTNGGSTMSCVADLIASSPGLEIAAGAALYKLPSALPTCDTAPCTGSLDLVWDATLVEGNAGRLSGEGFCAIADVWGADPSQAPGPENGPDAKPEVILIQDGELKILDGETGKIILDQYLGGGTYRGGAPNVDDFDGDGFMEIASALETQYIVVDLQPSTGSGGSCPDWTTEILRNDAPGGTHNTNPARNPGGSCSADSDCDPAAVCNKAVGQCVCLHNGWKRRSDDGSSANTSSSVFDFNGDGAAEVLYNDECEFRVYAGTDGEVLFLHESRSRTGTENPVVADVDNDGNAEVVTTLNTETIRCDDDKIDPNGLDNDQTNYMATGPNGLRVWGDPSDTWIAARRIWNQQSYHVTNVAESGAIPTHEPESWKSWQERRYNTYRSQPRGFGVAPDLTVAGLGISSPDAQCGALSDNIDISFDIANIGDLRVGPGVAVAFFGTWDGQEEALKDTNGNPLQVVLEQSLEPGRSLIHKVNFAHADNTKSILPSTVRVVVDAQTSEHPDGAERECREDNNDKSAAVDPGSLRADLTVELLSVSESDCPNSKVETKVRNIGTAQARNVVVRYYAGDPAQGGQPLHEQALSEPVAASSDVTFTAVVPIPPGRSITIFALIDPDKKVTECDEANNADADDKKLYCEFSPQ